MALLLAALLLVISHPDDEAMFFSPLVFAMEKNLRILSLSNGGFEGLGSVRAAEMQRAARHYGCEAKVLDDWRLRDGPEEHWEPRVVAEVVGHYLDSLPEKPEALAAFDDRGASMHPNHRATSQGLRLLHTQRPLLLFELRTQPFLGPLALLLPRGTAVFVVYNTQPWKTWAALSTHASQFLWYRKLFIWLSAYTYANHFTLVDDENRSKGERRHFMIDDHSSSCPA